MLYPNGVVYTCLVLTLSHVPLTASLPSSPPIICETKGVCEWSGLVPNMSAIPDFTLAERYLYTLRQSLTGTLTASPDYKDSVFSVDRRLDGKDWPIHGATMIGVRRMAALHEIMRYVYLAKQLDGDFLETGIWRGGSCIYAKGFMEAYGIRQKVWGLDSFAGLPVGQHPRDPYYNFQSFLSASLELVEDNFKRYQLWGDGVELVKGWFEDTLPTVRERLKRLAILRLDGDLYKSTLETLCFLYDRLVIGGFWIMDDFMLYHARTAALNFIKFHNLTERPTRLPDRSAFFQKQHDATVNWDWCRLELNKRGSQGTTWNLH
eukprot:TRINITY_DN97194_c0_g1_i1.p1 TRINITY_DN97194_c0_g1~~TRINITY_DN97194_c0_g1_i1.p1  ORF type:complete len:320 (-),score=37.02 TRINITY_DN97194_c0_g1_i1:44-1003(-)